MLYRDYSRKTASGSPTARRPREPRGHRLPQAMNEVVGSERPGRDTWPRNRPPSRRLAPDLRRRPGLPLQMEHGLDARHAAVHRATRCTASYHHGEMTFGLVYAFSENFVLPLSHDEVVHGKGSLLGKMPGDRWQKFANLRAYYGFMWGHPGKKLLFMGGEFAQEREWNHDQSLDWHLLGERAATPACSAWCDLNRCYRATPALHRARLRRQRLRWIDPRATRSARCSAFVRKRRRRARWCWWCATSRRPCAAAIGRRAGAGTWRERINTDSGTTAAATSAAPAADAARRAGALPRPRRTRCCSTCRRWPPSSSNVTAAMAAATLALGAHVDGHGVHFRRVLGACARIDCACIFDAADRKLRRRPCPRAATTSGTAACRARRRAGLRAARPRPYGGPSAACASAAQAAARPYARELVGRFEMARRTLRRRRAARRRWDLRDNAAHALKARVVEAHHDRHEGKRAAPHVPAEQTVIYELHVRASRSATPACRGLAAPSRAWPATPPSRILQAARRDHAAACCRCSSTSTNAASSAWASSTTGATTPSPSLPRRGAGQRRRRRAEFRAMVARLHGHGLEVVLDVVYNHSAESDEHGPRFPAAASTTPATTACRTIQGGLREPLHRLRQHAGPARQPRAAAGARQPALLGRRAGRRRLPLRPRAGARPRRPRLRRPRPSSRRWPRIRCRA